MNAVLQTRLSALVLSLFTFPAYVLAGDAVLISIRYPETVVPHATLTIADVAEVSGKDKRRCDEIGRLDLEFLDGGESYEVSKGQIRLRTLLAGYSDVRIDGYAATKVQRSDVSTHRQSLKEQIVAQICAQFSCPSEQIELTLAHESEVRLLIGRLRSPEFKVELAPLAKMPVGKQRLELRILLPNKESFVTQLHVNSAVLSEVAITKQVIASGQEIEASMLETVVRPISSRSQGWLQASELVGKIAKKRLDKNVLIAQRDVAEPQATIVRPYTLLDVVTEVGNAEIRLRDARLMQSAKIGARARFKNTKTGREFSAVLVSPSLARIERIR